MDAIGLFVFYSMETYWALVALQKIDFVSSKYIIFKGRQLDQSIALLCMCWKLGYHLPLHQSGEHMAVSGLIAGQTHPQL